MYKFITNFNYIYFFLIFYIETKQEKIIFLNYFLFFIVFFGTKSSLKILHIKNNNKLYNNLIKIYHCQINFSLMVVILILIFKFGMTRQVQDKSPLSQPYSLKKLNRVDSTPRV